MVKNNKNNNDNNNNNNNDDDSDALMGLDVCSTSCLDGLLSMPSSASASAPASSSKKMNPNIRHRASGGLQSSLSRQKVLQDVRSVTKAMVSTSMVANNFSIRASSQRSRLLLAAMSASPKKRLFVSQETVDKKEDDENDVVFQWGTESIPVQVNTDDDNDSEEVPKTLVASNIVFLQTRQCCPLKDCPSSFSPMQEEELMNWKEPPRVDDDSSGWIVTSSSTSFWWRSLASWLNMLQATILFVNPAASSSSQKYLLYHSKLQIKLIPLLTHETLSTTNKQKEPQITSSQCSIISSNDTTTKSNHLLSSSSSSQMKKQINREDIISITKEKQGEESTTEKALMIITWSEWSRACISYCHSKKDDGEISTITYLVELCRQLPSIVFSMQSSSSSSPLSKRDILQSTMNLLSTSSCYKKNIKVDDGNNNNNKKEEECSLSLLSLWCTRMDILSRVQQRTKEQYEFLVKWLILQICLRLTLSSKFGSKLLEKIVTKMKVTRELTSLLECLALLIMNDPTRNFSTILLELIDPPHIDRKCKMYLLNHFEIQSSSNGESQPIPIEEEDSEQVQSQGVKNQGEQQQQQEQQAVKSPPRLKPTTVTQSSSSSSSIIMTPKTLPWEVSTDNDGNETNNSKTNEKDKSVVSNNSIQQFYSMKKQRTNNPLLQKQYSSSTKRNKMMMVPPNLLQQVTTTTTTTTTKPKTDSPIISSPPRNRSIFSSPLRRGPRMMLPPASPASPYLATPPHYMKRVVMETPDQHQYHSQGFKSPSSFCSDNSCSTGASIYDTPQKRRGLLLSSKNKKRPIPILAMDSPDAQSRQKKFKAASVVAQVNIAMRKQQQKQGSPQHKRKIDFQDCE